MLREATQTFKKAVPIATSTEATERQIMQLARAQKEVKARSCPSSSDVMYNGAEVFKITSKMNRNQITQSRNPKGKAETTCY